jgi:hypothetical protein
VEKKIRRTFRPSRRGAKKRNGQQELKSSNTHNTSTKQKIRTVNYGGSTFPAVKFWFRKFDQKVKVHNS